MKESPFGTSHDTRIMQAALRQARVAFRKGEVPIGAVVVGPDGTIISRGHNLIEKRQTQTAHAEIIALEKAARKKSGWRLNGCWLYVTLEPCAMCVGLMRLSRIDGIVYGAPSPLFGGSLDTESSSSLYKVGAFQVVRGVAAQESADLLGSFFKERRENRE